MSGTVPARARCRRPGSTRRCMSVPVPSTRREPSAAKANVEPEAAAEVVGPRRSRGSVTRETALPRVRMPLRSRRAPGRTTMSLALERRVLEAGPRSRRASPAANSSGSLADTAARAPAGRERHRPGTLRCPQRDGMIRPDDSCCSVAGACSREQVPVGRGMKRPGRNRRVAQSEPARASPVARDRTRRVRGVRGRAAGSRAAGLGRGGAGRNRCVSVASGAEGLTPRRPVPHPPPPDEPHHPGLGHVYAWAAPSFGGRAPGSPALIISE